MSEIVMFPAHKERLAEDAETIANRILAALRQGIEDENTKVHEVRIPQGELMDLNISFYNDPITMELCIQFNKRF